MKFWSQCFFFVVSWETTMITFLNLARNLNTVSLRQGKHSSDLIFLIHQNILYSSCFYNVDVLMPFTAISYNSFLSFINLRIYFCKLLCSAARAENLLKHLESTEEDGFTRPRRTLNDRTRLTTSLRSISWLLCHAYSLCPLFTDSSYLILSTLNNSRAVLCQLKK